MRAVSISVQMGKGEKVGDFAIAVNSTLRLANPRLPRISSSLTPVTRRIRSAENVHLFMTSLYEAISWWSLSLSSASGSGVRRC